MITNWSHSLFYHCCSWVYLFEIICSWTTSALLIIKFWLWGSTIGLPIVVPSPVLVSHFSYWGWFSLSCVESFVFFWRLHILSICNNYLLPYKHRSPLPFTPCFLWLASLNILTIALMLTVGTIYRRSFIVDLLSEIDVSIDIKTNPNYILFFFWLIYLYT